MLWRRKLQGKYSWNTSSMLNGFNADISSYDVINENRSTSYRTEKSEKSRNVVTIDMFDKLVENEFYNDMTEKNVHNRIRIVFGFRKLQLGWSRYTWLIGTNEKIVVYHIFSINFPELPSLGPCPDLKPSRNNTRRDFEGFMTDAIKLFQTIYMVDVCATTKHHWDRNTKKVHGRRWRRWQWWGLRQKQSRGLRSVSY